nr:XkdX family protein [uncultured Anaerosporobacter sp.]
MYNRLLNLYTDGLLSEEGLSNAVKKDWIKEEQRQQIINFITK